MSYDYWQNALQGKFGAIHDGTPWPGFYRRRMKGKPDEAVAIWQDGDAMLAVSNGAPVDANDIWTWICTSPITEDVYRAVAERGEPWPDAIEALIGRSNSPVDPREAEYDEINSAVDAALAALKEPVNDQAAADRLGNHRDRLSKLWKAQDEKRKTEKQPHMDAAKAVDEAYKPMLGRIEDAGAKIKAALTAFLLAEDRRRREEQAAEFKRQEEARKAAIAANEPPPAPAPLPEVERPKVGTAGRATALRTYRRAEITDYAAALKHFAENAEVREAVQALADRCARAQIEVPGCKIIEERKAA